jgi:N-acetylmuramoyl-L-alanine amidase
MGWHPPRSTVWRLVALGTLTASTLTALAACGASGAPQPPRPSAVGSPVRSVLSSSHPAVASSSSAGPVRPSSKPARTTAKPAPTGVAPSRNPPVIVLDPGHSPTIHQIDPATGLDVSDYENEPEMRDVFAVALLVRARLIAAGYRVVLTKHSADERVSLAGRAAIANAAHAALAVSIHDQAGPNGGIGFDRGNNIVYYQAVGDYRETAGGRKVFFTDGRLAALSRTYGQIFRAQRAQLEGHAVQLRSNVGYDLGSRGLAPGNIWLVQLLSRVPWIYNESGGNSAGRSGLSPADQRRYADALVAAVERCITPPG